MLSVVIGRFQTPYLHEGHQELLREARDLSGDLLILIGCTAAIGTDKNPLDFKTRKSMFECKMPCEVKPLHDMLSDQDWSNQIDKIIANLGFSEATIFAGRDNSVEGRYFGKHKIKIIDEKGGKSATALRKQAAQAPKDSSDFRAGIIYHAENRYPIVYSTVDVAIEKDGKYLVGKKGDKYCFIGGFVDPSDDNLFVAAHREAGEETGIEKLYSVTYCGSIRIEDERYKGTKDCIMTHLISFETSEEVNYDKIQDKEFKDFVWATKEELEELLHDFHKPLLTFI
jgi:bifunctional NMN adenylyltransferase/nudix hydrolase